MLFERFSFWRSSKPDYPPAELSIQKETDPFASATVAVLALHERMLTLALNGGALQTTRWVPRPVFASSMRNATAARLR